MADYRNDDDRTLPGAPGMNRTPETNPEHLIPEHTHAVAPGTIAAQVTSDDPDVVRGEIERTRQRMSSTIDEIEDVLLRKKGEIQEKLDVTAPVRERPWAFAGGVFGAGLLLGFLTGGKGNGGEEDHEYVKVPRALLEGAGVEEASGSGAGFSASARGGAGEWEGRTRELMQVVARQEEEIRDLRAVVYGDRDWDVDALGDAEMGQPESLGAVDVEEEWDEDWNFSDEDDDFDTIEALGYEGEADEGGLHIGKPLAGLIAAGVAGIVAGAARKLIAGRGGEEMDVQVELEPSGGASIVDDRTGRYDGLADAREAMATPRQPAQAPRFTGRTPPHGVEEGERDYPYTNRPPSYGRPVEVEVELEQPQPHGYARPAQHRGISLPEMPEMSPLAGAVAVGAAVAISGLVARILHTRSHREEMDVEVELEDRSGYRPSARPQAAYAPPRTAQTGGEMQVEVELEGQGARQPRAYTEPPTYPHAAQQGQAGEMQVEVDLENRGGTSDSQFGGTSDGTDRRPQTPPLM